MYSNFECFDDIPVVVDIKGKYLFGCLVGVVEVVTGCCKVEDHMEYETNIFHAYKLDSGGSIVYLDRIPDGKPQRVNSLKGKLFSISWGSYTPDVPQKWRAIPRRTFAPRNTFEVEELPF